MANSSTSNQRRGRRTFERRSGGFWAGVSAAVVLMFGLLVNGIVTAGQLAADHWPSDWTPSALWKADKSRASDKSHAALSLDGKTLYITMFYQGNPKPLQTWKATFSGANNMSVDMEDTETHNKIKGNAFVRASGISISYGSEDPTRFGYGVFALQRKTSAVASDPVVFSGTAVVHDCECTDGSTHSDGNLLNVPTLMSERPVPTPAEVKLFLSKEPREAVGVKPAELRSDAQQQSSVITNVIRLATAVDKVQPPPPPGRACSCTSVSSEPNAA